MKLTKQKLEKLIVEMVDTDRARKRNKFINMFIGGLMTLAQASIEDLNEIKQTGDLGPFFTARHERFRKLYLHGNYILLNKYDYTLEKESDDEYHFPSTKITFDFQIPKGRDIRDALYELYDTLVGMGEWERNTYEGDASLLKFVNNYAFMITFNHREVLRYLQGEFLELKVVVEKHRSYR